MDKAIFKTLSAHLLAKSFNIAGSVQAAVEITAQAIAACGLTGGDVGGAVAPVYKHGGGINAEAAVDFLSGDPGVTYKAPMVIAIIGENHKSGADRGRAQMLMSRASKGKKKLLCVLERAIVHASLARVLESRFDTLLTEEEIYDFHLAASERQRSVVIAAAVAIWLAQLSQKQTARALILIGDNHVDDVEEAAEALIQRSDAFRSLRSRNRVYYTIRSQA